MTAIDNGAVNAKASSDTTTVNIVYILYLVGFFTGITALIGVIVAYVCRAEASEIGRSHFNHQIRIFWRGVILLMVAGALYLVASFVGMASMASGAMAMAYNAPAMGFGALGVGALLMLVPLAVSAYWAIWTIYRVVKGLVSISKERAI